MVLVLLLLLAGTVGYKEYKVREFESIMDSYIDTTVEMDSIVKKYNEPSTLSVERLYLIEDYLELQKDRHTKDTIKHIDENSLVLELGKIDTSEIIEELEKEKNNSMQNIKGFSEDLEKLNDSILITYTGYTKEKHNELKEKIKSHLS